VRYLGQVHFNRDATTSCIGKHERDDRSREELGPGGMWSRGIKQAKLRSSNRTKFEKHLYLDRVQLRFSRRLSLHAESQNISVRTSGKRFRVADKCSLSSPRTRARFWCKRTISLSIFFRGFYSKVDWVLDHGTMWVKSK